MPADMNDRPVPVVDSTMNPFRCCDGERTTDRRDEWRAGPRGEPRGTEGLPHRNRLQTLGRERTRLSRILCAADQYQGVCGPHLANLPVKPIADTLVRMTAKVAFTVGSGTSAGRSFWLGQTVACPHPLMPASAGPVSPSLSTARVHRSACRLLHLVGGIDFTNRAR